MMRIRNRARLSSEQGTENSADSEEIRTAKRTKSAPHLVERATAPRGQSIARPQEPKSIRRLHTRMDIYEKDAEIPYVKVEGAVRDLVCSLVKRQDRMNEEIFSKINDLAYRIDDIEEDQTGEGGSA